MEIKTRKQAAAAGESKYFTGKPCKNDHTTYRYTTSGACAACIREASTGARVEMTLTDTRAAKAEARAELAVVKIRAYPADMETIKGTALALTRARYPAATMADVVPNAALTRGESGTFLLSLRAHPSDHAILADVGRALVKREVDFSAVRARQQQLIRDANAAGNIPTGPLK